MTGRETLRACRRSRHVWQVGTREEQPSAVEIMQAAGTPITAKSALPDDFVEITRRPVLVTRRCKVCGTEEVVRV